MDDIRIEKITGYLGKLKNAIIAYSGGVDSTLLLKVAVGSLGRESVKAVTVLSPLLPPWDYEYAKKFSRELGIEHIFMDGSDKLGEEKFTRNDTYRCYFCKKFNYRIIKRKFPGLPVLSGTNSSDASDFRPGMKAEKEEGILTPFLDLGITKNDIRELSYILRIPGANRPPSACLASRIWTGESITEEKLEMVKKAEMTLRELGINDILRVRYLAGCFAKIETNEMEKIINSREIIIQILKGIGFRGVFVDIEGYAPSGKFYQKEGNYGNHY